MADRATGAVTSKAVGDAEATAPPAPVSPAAALAPSGITLKLSPAGLRLIVAPVSSWRQLSRWYWAAILPAAAAVWLATEALGLNGGGRQPDLWPPVVEFVCIALAVAGHAVWRVTHR